MYEGFADLRGADPFRGGGFRIGHEKTMMPCEAKSGVPAATAIRRKRRWEDPAPGEEKKERGEPRGELSRPAVI